MAPGGKTSLEERGALFHSSRLPLISRKLAYKLLSRSTSQCLDLLSYGTSEHLLSLSWFLMLPLLLYLIPLYSSSCFVECCVVTHVIAESSIVELGFTR